MDIRFFEDNRSIVTKAYKRLEALGNSASKTRRTEAVMEEIVDAFKGTKKQARFEASCLVDVHNDYSLLRDRLCAAYARDVKRDSFGKIDERKVLVSFLRILKQEGIGFTNWGWSYSAETLLAYFAAQDIAERETRLLTPQDKGIEYEKAVLEQLSAMCSFAEMTPPGADFGVDIVFEYRGIKFAAQCKAFERAVGVSAVQEVVAGRDHYQADRSIVFSKNGFSDAALKLADSNKVVCIEALDLSSLDRQLAALS